MDSLFITDPKVVTTSTDTHVSQMLGYLNIAELQLALLLNLKEAKLHWKRVENEHPKGNHGSCRHDSDLADHTADLFGERGAIHDAFRRLSQH